MTNEQDTPSFTRPGPRFRLARKAPIETETTHADIASGHPLSGCAAGRNDCRTKGGELLPSSKRSVSWPAQCDGRH